MNTDPMFSSATDLWSTPQDYFDSVSKEFAFTLDVCALPENAKCQKFFSPKEDGLSQKWEGVCWMNPPYGREIGKWVQKAYESAKQGTVIVGLLPARTDIKWFHDYIYGKSEVRFIRGRLRFGGCKNPAPFPSMLVIWKKEHRITNEENTDDTRPKLEALHRLDAPTLIEKLASIEHD